MWKAVVFDLDGVLLDTEPLQYKAWANVLKRRGVKFNKKDYGRYAGRSTEDIAKGMEHVYGLKNLDDFIREREDEIIRLVCEMKLVFLPGVIEAINCFKHAGMKSAIATSTLDGPEMDAKMSKTGLDKMFNVVVNGSDVTRMKPNPDIYLKAAEKLGVTPSECIAIEDTPAGAHAATSAGMTCFAVPNPYTKNKKFPGAENVFGSLAEVVDYIKHLAD